MSSRLADAVSPYLRSAAHQPVAWHPWGAEAFARAHDEQKPILLDIGATWCHWCHVMDGESYEDPAIAALLNRDWVCIKVDRDERPDVDTRYQRAVQAISGQGGWPLTAFLTPDGDVFFGGTYFPPDGKYGRPGFATVLTDLARTFREQPDTIADQAAAIRAHLREAVSHATPGPSDGDVLARAADGMARLFDFRYGGFGTQPKFPHPTACEFLLAHWQTHGFSWAREIVDRTLTAMALGGIHDQIGGGFHRYSVDARWIVPHFEKMAYDNSALLSAYVHAASVPPGEDRHAAALYRTVIEGVIDWVTTVMADPAGGYFASQDADVGLHDDGDYFTWTAAEARAALDAEEFAIAASHYGIAEHGDMHHNPAKNVLRVERPPDAVARALDLPADHVARRLTSIRRKLRQARDARSTPFVDRTIYTGWNAMMVSAVLRAGAFLDRAALDDHALRTLDRIFREAGRGPGLAHALGSDVHGILDDQVLAANAAIDAYEATGTRDWLDRAETLMRHVGDTYAAPDGGLWDRAGEGGEGFLVEKLIATQDAPTPSGNGVAAIAMARLAEHTGDAAWGEARRVLLDATAGNLADLGMHAATMLMALGWSHHPATHIVVVAEDDDAGRALRRAARVVYGPRKVVTLRGPTADDRGLPPAVQAAMDGGAPRAYICEGARCHPPVDSADALFEVLYP